MPSKKTPVNVKSELARYESLRSKDEWWRSWWQNINEMCLPRRAYITEQETTPDGEQYDRIYDTTAIAAVDGLASMMTSRLTPTSGQWQQWGVPPELQDEEEAISWMQEMSEICMKYKASSTFYRDTHETNIDLSGPGTGCLYLGHSKEGNGFFDYKHIELGSYSFVENSEGVADQMWREFRATAMQTREMFPEGKFGSKMGGAESGSQPSDYTKEFRILHIVRKRKDYDESKIDRENMPYEELYICIEDECLIHEGGYKSFPFMVSRFQKWGNQHVWGVSPCRKAMPAIHQANFLQEMADELTELQVRPRFKQLASMIGQVDLRAGGRTLGKNREQLDSLQEWMTNGRLDVAMARIEQKQGDIKNLFFRSLWEPLQNVDRDVTAREIDERVRQDEMLFSPTLNSYMTDYQPLARREYQMLMDAGKHPEIPGIILEYMGDTGEIPDPVMSIKTDLTLAIQRHQAGGMDRLFERLAVMHQLDPELVDEFDLAQAMREIARVEGVNERVIRDEEDVIDIKEARQVAAAEQQQLDQASQLAEAAGKAPQEMVDAAMGSL